MTWTGPKRRYRAVLLGFGCALFVYLLVRLGAAEISSLLLGVGWYFGLIAATYAGHQLIRAIAYWKCVTANERSSYWDIVRIRLSGEAIQFLTSTGPFLAEPAKVWLLRRRGLSTKHAVAATVSEYLIYTLTSAAFAIAGLTYLLINFELSRPASVAAKIRCIRDGCISPRGRLRDHFSNLLDRRHHQGRQQAAVDWEARAPQGE